MPVPPPAEFWSLFENEVVLPEAKTVEAYKVSIPDDFLFTIKVPNSLTLTHFYNKNKSQPLIKNPHFLSEELYETFIDSIKPLNNNIGSLIFQFEYLNKDKMSSFSEFQRLLHQFFTSLPSGTPPIGLEIRNPYYLNSGYFKFLNQLNLSHVFLEGYFMSPIVEIYNKHKDLIKGQTIIRLHGPDRSGIEKMSDGNWNKIYIDRENDLRSIAGMIKDLLNRDITVYLNVNNHYEGCAPMTIERTKGML
jgi:uncharacterized protein YecE (DUF72 family)